MQQGKSIARLGWMIVLIVLASATVSWVVVSLSLKQIDTSTGGQGTAPGENAKEEVLSTGSLRAGYAIYPPASQIDPNTGELSGIMIDALEAAGDSLSIEIEWVEEVPWATMIEGLDTDRYDIIGSGVWANPARAKRANFTMPLYYNTVGAYARVGDARFAAGIPALRALGADLRIAVIDGEMSALIAERDFPLAAKVGLPQISEGIQLLQEVAAGKADVTFIEPSLANKFIASNPGSVANIDPLNPVRVFPTVYMLREEDDELQQMLDVALQELVTSGYVDRLIEAYAQGSRESFLPVDQPYRLKEN